LRNFVPPFNLDSVRSRLPGRRIDWFDTLDSTMIEARRDMEPGRIVGAEEQTAGVGRHGRKWISEAGAGLYVSMILAAKPVPVIMLSLGLAIRQAVGGADLRWPNDVLLNGKKCAGVLAHLESKPDGDTIIAGIGINVSQAGFPVDLETPATSLLLEGIQIAREDLLVALVQFVDRYTRFCSSEILQQFTSASSYVSGKRVRAEGGLEGVTCGLDRAGFLRVREDNGAETTILSGGVRPV